MRASIQVRATPSAPWRAARRSGRRRCRSGCRRRGAVDDLLSAGASSAPRSWSPVAATWRPTACRNHSVPSAVLYSSAPVSAVLASIPSETRRGRPRAAPRAPRPRGRWPGRAPRTRSSGHATTPRTTGSRRRRSGRWRLDHELVGGERELRRRCRRRRLRGGRRSAARARAAATIRGRRRRGSSNGAAAAVTVERLAGRERRRRRCPAAHRSSLSVEPARGLLARVDAPVPLAAGRPARRRATR